MKRTFITVVLVIFGLALGLGAVSYVVELHADRHAMVIITGPVRVYDRESPPGYTRGDDGVIQFLHESDPVRVLRIHDNNGVESIHVRLRDGREGYIFCCDNFTLSR